RLGRWSKTGGLTNDGLPGILAQSAFGSTRAVGCGLSGQPGTALSTGCCPPWSSCGTMPSVSRFVKTSSAAGSSSTGRRIAAASGASRKRAAIGSGFAAFGSALEPPDDRSPPAPSDRADRDHRHLGRHLRHGQGCRDRLSGGGLSYL